MMQTLIVCEKPDAAARVARALDEDGDPRRIETQGVPVYESRNRHETQTRIQDPRAPTRHTTRRGWPHSTRTRLALRNQPLPAPNRTCAQTEPWKLNPFHR